MNFINIWMDTVLGKWPFPNRKRQASVFYSPLMNGATIIFYNKWVRAKQNGIKNSVKAVSKVSTYPPTRKK